MEQVCKRCHGPADFDVCGTALCENCYGIIGSCCMEMDGDDLFLEEKSWWETRILPKAEVIPPLSASGRPAPGSQVRATG